MHIPPKIIGYMAVENPLHHEDATFPYRGTDRNPWWGLVLPYYDGHLSAAMTQILKPILSVKNLSGLELCTNFADLAQLDLEHTCPGCEVIGLWSPLLAMIRPPDIVPSATFLGFEVKVVGEFSLILSGQYSGAAILKPTLSLLNQFGLFDDIDLARSYAREYQRAANSGLAEQTSPDYEIISIYHVCSY